MRTTKTAGPRGPKTTGARSPDSRETFAQTLGRLTTMGVGFRIFRGSAYTRVPVPTLGTNVKEQGQ